MRAPIFLLTAILLAMSAFANAESAEPEIRPDPVAAEASVSLAAPDKTQDLLLYALSLNGTRYKYGGRSIDTGFDCSGFVRYVYGQAAGLTLPNTAHAISQVGAQIAKNELKPGDLVFFNTLRRAFSHVGIYLGENRFIHASSSSTGDVMVSDLNEKYWSKRFNGARRYALSE
jgi:cell wall-associated NlpC family hydrolase